MAKDNTKYVNQGAFGFAYFLGMIAALVFYLQQSHGFWEIVLAFLKAPFWFGFVVYDLMRVLAR